MIWLLMLFLSLLLVFVFSAYETAYLVCQKKSFVGTKAVYRNFLMNVEHVMTTTLVGLNFFAASASIVSFYFIRSTGITTGKAVAIAGVIISLTLLFVEFYAKSFARKNNTIIISTFTPFLKVFSYLAVPINRLILFLIFPVRAIRGEIKKDTSEMLKLMVSEAVMDGELDSGNASIILSFSRWKDLKVMEFSEELDPYIVNLESTSIPSLSAVHPIFVREGDTVLGMLNLKKLLLTGSIKNSIEEVPTVAWNASVDEVLRKIVDYEEKVALVEFKNEKRFFYFNTFLQRLMGDVYE